MPPITDKEYTHEVRVCPQSEQLDFLEENWHDLKKQNKKLA